MAISLARAADVSVVIPCFRCAGTIKRAVASIAQQTLMPAEVILVDDCSADGTLAALREIEQAYPGWVKVLPTDENRGAASARNAGWAASNRTYIAFLDADDAWHPRKIEIQHSYMNNHPEVVLCGHGHRQLGQADALPDWDVPAWDELKISKWPLLLSNKFVTPSIMIRRDINQRFVDRQRHMEDHMLWLEVVCGGGLAVRLSAELAAIYKRPFGAAGLSAQIWSMERGDLGNYRRLYRVNCINVWQWCALSIYSLLKFVRRLLIYWGKVRWKK